jgi:hypothetical protein
VKQPPVSHTELLALLDYSIVSGKLYWRVARTNGSKAGDRAGFSTTLNYWNIGIKGREYGAHRVA